jgi:hypothetical protein
MLLSRRFKAELLNGEVLFSSRDGSYGQPPIFFPRPALLPVWDRHRAVFRRGFMVAPA